MTSPPPAASIFVPVARTANVPASPFYASRARALGVALLCALAVLVARTLLILTFGSSLPFWDQWGAEGTAIYKALIEGNYAWSHLWTAHNEHRIALTRLSAIALFELNQQQWDVRVQCLANSLIVAVSTGLFAWYLQRRMPTLRAAVLCLLLVLAGALPFSWENTIAGFQNAFFFLVLLNLLVLWTTAHRPATPTTFVVLCLLAVLTVFTLATGILTLLAGVVVLALRAFSRRNSWPAMAVLMLPLLGVLIIAALHIPQLDYHAPLKAQGLLELAHAFAITASWPFLPPAALLFALPFVFFLWRVLQRCESDPVDLFFIGLFVWSALTALATAYSRGHGLQIVPSRYTDLLALGSIAYAYFALRFPDGGMFLGRWPARLLRAAVPTLIAAGFVLQSVLYVPFLLDRHFLTRIETINVRAFVEGDALALTDKPPFYIPFPEAAGLASALSDTTVRRVLPVSVRAPASQAADPARSCALQVLPGTIPPLDYTPRCGDRAVQASEIPVGRLSALTYRLWQALAAPLLPRLVPSSPMPPLQADMRCAIDALNAAKPTSGNVFSVPYAATLRMAGWAGGLGRTAPPRKLEIGLVSETGIYYRAEASARLPRPDVQAALADSGMKWAGFDLGVDASAVPHGRYRIVFGDAGLALCDTAHLLDIRSDSDERLNY